MPYLTREQVREVDRRATEQFGIPGIVLMENAARAASDIALTMLPRSSAAKEVPDFSGDAVDGGVHSTHDRRGRRSHVPADVSKKAGTPAANVLILCGGGNNGGDGLAIARHLHNAGCAVQVALTVDPARYPGDAAINWRIVHAMGIPVSICTPAMITAKGWDLIIDAIFGTGLDRPPREPFPEIAGAVNASGRPVLAIDVPSGLDCDSGRPLGACIRATRTITFVAPKIGFSNPGACEYTGIVEIGDIGCPRELV